jgi:hypothetical protein
LRFTGDGTFLVSCQAQTPTTTSNFFAITVALTVPTIGAPFVRTSTSTTFGAKSTYEYPKATDDQLNLAPYDANNMLCGYGAQPFALSVSGTTLSEGAGITGVGTSRGVFDATLGTNFFIVGSNIFVRATISSGAITAVETVATTANPTFISSTTLTDQAVKYSGSWYSWALTTTQRMLTPTKWLAVSGADIKVLGEIT